ncbi:hypothetical protein [Xylophilus sp. GOD-11R]|uniref:hypothetical protein n=1 Tax=Xylophilus sp. GOD-11R TaxID=3089814 RepID=UPI00298C5B98|nr:hypothetical protein [Xylophilus sp. GOD-11R]WPB56225.1 hypothetical protein R9X41_19080 [Xylophilus sp. GOD-11R]
MGHLNHTGTAPWPLFATAEVEAFTEPPTARAGRSVDASGSSAEPVEFGHPTGHYLGLLAAGDTAGAARHRNQTLTTYGTTAARRLMLEHRLDQADQYHQSLDFLLRRSLAGTTEPMMRPFIREAVSALYQEGTADLVRGRWPDTRLGTTEFILERARQAADALDARTVPQIERFYDQAVHDAEAAASPPRNGGADGCALEDGSLVFTGLQARQNAMRFAPRPVQHEAILMAGAPLIFPANASAVALTTPPPPPRLRPATANERWLCYTASRVGAGLGRVAGRKAGIGAGPTTGLQDRARAGGRAGARAGARAATQALLTRLRAGADVQEALAAGREAATREGARAGLDAMSTRQAGMELALPVRYENADFRHAWAEPAQPFWRPRPERTTLLLLARDPDGARPDRYSEDGGYHWQPLDGHNTPAQEAARAAGVDRLRNATAAANAARA